MSRDLMSPMEREARALYDLWDTPSWHAVESEVRALIALIRARQEAT